MRIYHLNPPSSNEIVTTNTAWMSFRSHFPEHDWIMPIYNWDELCTVSDIVNVILDKDPDVLLASIYVWNEPLVLDVLKEIHRQRQDLIVIVGGPQVPDKHEYLIDNPCVDAICSGSGEVFLEHALPQLENSGTFTDFTSIPFIRTRDGKSTVEQRFKWGTGNIIADSFDYLCELKMFAETNGREFCIDYETTRGCPYACTYCEWGGGVGTRVNPKPINLVKEELELLLQLMPSSIGVLDANFGILKRDDEIIDLIGEAKQVTGYPRNVDLFGLTKSKMERRYEILKKMFHYELEDSFFLAMQSSDDDVLQAVKRTDIGREEYLQLYQRLKAEFPHITVKVELILGLPNSTLGSFYREMDYIQLVGSWGFKRYLFFLLPNSEASDSTYRRQYKMSTFQYDMAKILVGDVDDRETRLIGEDTVLFKYGSVVDVVNATRSYSKEDWITMHLLNTIQDYLGPHINKRASVVFPRVWDKISNGDWFDEVVSIYGGIFNNEAEALKGMSLSTYLLERIGDPKKFLEDVIHESDPEPICLE